jgi:ketosteroid isomerase-like protein
MTRNSPDVEVAAAWEQEIRAREEEARLAFLTADVRALDELWADDYVVNSPLQQVLRKSQVIELLRAGRIRHTSFEVAIEYLGRHGDVVVVMGRDTVSDPPDGAVSRRRYSNVWRLDGGVWRSIARHAHLVSREPAG